MRHHRRMTIMMRTPTIRLAIPPISLFRTTLRLVEKDQHLPRVKVFTRSKETFNLYLRSLPPFYPYTHANWFRLLNWFRFGSFNFASFCQKQQINLCILSINYSKWMRLSHFHLYLPTPKKPSHFMSHKFIHFSLLYVLLFMFAWVRAY